MSRHSKWSSWQQLIAPGVDTPVQSHVFEVAPEMKEWVESTAPEIEPIAEAEPPINLKKVVKTKK